MLEKNQISGDDSGASALYRKLNWRLLPILLIGFVFAYLDRVNVGFAKLQMQSDLQFSDAVYGVGAGIFFVGYVLFELPSNLLLPKIGARATFSRIMVLWGITSACMMFVHSVPAFYAVRFLLGVFEAGFAPGVLFYLSRWYGPSRAAGAISIVWLAGPISGIFGGPVAGWLMTDFVGVGNLSGWQWMFLLEGAPCVVLGIVAFFLLPDRPDTAAWLNAEEKRLLAAELGTAKGRHGSFGAVVKDPKVYVLAIAYLCIIAPIYATSFWLPTIFKLAGAGSTVEVGWYAAIPYAAAALAIFYGGRSSDRHGERRYHIAVPVFIAFLSICAWVFFDGSLLAAIVLFTLATAMTWMANVVFWAVPSEYIKGDASAGAIAFINTIGLSGGFWGPAIIGWAKTATGNMHLGFLVMAAMLLVSAILIFLLRLSPKHPATVTSVSETLA
ncbi:MFS transporter [Paraburkholderia madseniana]|uniref:MFS transporter n=1 Tax=Paraburkholderia madseniana TaxID=2599607 RepID=A0AAP5BC89_9BURK|nr:MULTISPECIES: MFS transporter [Paraburkholderia]MCX4146260.1 MFS transporter [Paraburkholderia madseniana]MDN7149206.1 MFS transporter [Paraburkholderia sp. WS6]MDQ6408086.1 MFS transporter [Paraburkholderia madseniana]